MRKTITLLLLFAFTTLSGWAQSISVTDISPSVQAGNTLTVNYKYTSAVPCKISCGVYLMSGEFGWTWVSTVVYDEVVLAPAGTNLTGTFNLLIPAGTAASATLTGTQNYKVQPELKTAGGVWLAGDYTINEYEITATGIVPAVSVASIPTSTQIGTNLVVNYKYTAATAGKISVVVTKNGGVNSYDYISTVAFDQLDPAPAGINVVGSFTVAIPGDTTPTSALTGNENYRVTLELKDASNTWLAGDYSQINYSFTASLTANEFNLDSKKISVYPNPVGSILNIANQSNLSDASFRISNIVGQTVKNSSVLSNEGIDVSNLSSGLYILSVDSKEGNKTVKFQKK
jgi:hypothetical protein